MEKIPSSTDLSIKRPYIDKTSFFVYGSSYYGEDMPKDMDYQGIEWKTLAPNGSRESFRRNRLENHHSLRQFPEIELKKYSMKTRIKEEPYYSFEKFYKEPTVRYQHQQLRENLIAPKKTSLLYPAPSGFTHYSLIDFKEKFFYIDDDLVPMGIDYHEDIVAICSLEGMLVLYDISQQKILYQKGITQDKDINNCARFLKNCKSGSSLKIACGCNDRCIDIFEINSEVRVTDQILMESPVNFVKESLTGNLLLVLADQKRVDVVDLRSQETVLKFHGHEDYGFSGDWHPNGYHIATGNQDRTCRIWDLRKPQKEFNILQSNLGCAISLRYSNSGSYLVVAESLDFVNIFNAEKSYENRQTIDFFGEPTGFDFDGEDGESLFIGVQILDYSGVFEYNLKKVDYLNSLSEFMF